MELPRHLQPSAAVIGAGISGVHVAKELATLGFKVTVFEEKDGAGFGATDQDCGIVFPPAFRLSMRKLGLVSEHILGLLPFSARPLLAAETPLMTMTNVPYLRWMSGRFFNYFADNRKLQSAGETLAAGSVVSMLDCLQQDPRLKSAVYATLQSPDGESGVGTPQPPTVKPLDSSAPYFVNDNFTDGLLVDPGRWTETLAKICEERLDVKFVYGHRVTRIQTKITNGVEWSPYIVVRDVKIPEHMSAEAANFDLVCVCAGPATTKITWFTDPVPLHPFGGYCLDMPLQEGAKTSVGEKLRTAVGLPALFDNITADGWLRGGPIMVPDGVDGKTKLGGIRLSGLASFDSTVINPIKPETALALFGRRLRVAFYGKIDGEIERDPEDPVDVNMAARRYERAFTPDGLPIVSRLGQMRNVYVCSGFGDNGAMLAPGAARLLAQIIVNRERTAELSPFSLARFRSFRYMDRDRAPPAFRGPRVVQTFERGLCNVGVVFQGLIEGQLMSSEFVQQYFKRGDVKS